PSPMFPHDRYAFWRECPTVSGGSSTHARFTVCPIGVYSVCVAPVLIRSIWGPALFSSWQNCFVPLLAELSPNSPAFSAPRVFDYPISSLVLAPRVQESCADCKSRAHSPDVASVELASGLARPTTHFSTLRGLHRHVGRVLVGAKAEEHGMAH